MTTIIKLFLAIILGLITQIVSAQNITGFWNGTLSVQGTELPIVINIDKEGDNYKAFLRSPKQSNQDIPVDKVMFENGKLFLVVNAMSVKYEGEVDGEKIKGIFTQGPGSMPLELKKGNLVSSKPKKRPQDPIKPYPYASEDVIFVNEKANHIKLAGTLTLPRDTENPPVVILISGSGPQNRNEELLNHRPFLVLSDHLTKQGIAVLRYDERGVGESEGKFSGATSLGFASDVEAAIEFLKKRNDVDTKKIGLIGHSEGGFIVPIIASTNKDVAFIISLAGTGVDGKQVLLTQMKKASELQGVSPEIIKVNIEFAEIVLSIIQQEQPAVMETKTKIAFEKHRNSLNEEMKKIYTMETLEQGFLTFTKDPWMHYFIKTDPLEFISKVRIPVLAINGSKDAQVISKLNLDGFKKGLEKSGNKDYTVKEIEGLNHLFQTSDTGAGTEYGTIEETFNPVAMKLVSDWILKRF